MCVALNTSMKYQPLFLLLCLLGGISSAHAQSRPFRVQIGGNYAAFGSISLDVKKNPGRSQVFSLYVEKLMSVGYGGGYDFDPTRIPIPATRLDSFDSIGVSVRRPIKRDTWVGVGLGGYTRHYRDSGSLDRNVTGIGGKVFIGYGRGTMIAEVSVVAPANLKDAALEYTVGLRL